MDPYFGKCPFGFREWTWHKCKTFSTLDYIGVLLGLYRDHNGIMEYRMETIVVGLIGRMVEKVPGSAVFKIG